MFCMHCGAGAKRAAVKLHADLTVKTLFEAFAIVSSFFGSLNPSGNVFG